MVKKKINKGNEIIAEEIRYYICSIESDSYLIDEKNCVSDIKFGKE